MGLLRWIKVRWSLARLPHYHDWAVVTDWSDGSVTVQGFITLSEAKAATSTNFYDLGADESWVWARPPRPWSWKRG